jgi:hypothetical protein
MRLRRASSQCSELHNITQYVFYPLLCSISTCSFIPTQSLPLNTSLDLPGRRRAAPFRQFPHHFPPQTGPQEAQPHLVDPVRQNPMSQTRKYLPLCLVLTSYLIEPRLPSGRFLCSRVECHHQLHPTCKGRLGVVRSVAQNAIITSRATADLAVSLA